jgi:anti-sigma factor RsiW
MEHSQFKVTQTAAMYVAGDLDASTMEAFEMHMMACPECVGDVESWRAIKSTIVAVPRPAAALHPARAAPEWRMAASLLLGAIVGTTGGWFVREMHGPAFDPGQITFFNMPAVTRGADECTRLRLSPEAKLAVLRVAGILEGQRLTALDSSGHELASSRYSVRLQPDGSQLASFDARVLLDGALQLQTRAADGSQSPLGCIAGEVVAAR